MRLAIEVSTMQQPEKFEKDGMSDEDVSAFVAATLGMKPQTEGMTLNRATRYITHYLRGKMHVESNDESLS